MTSKYLPSGFQFSQGNLRDYEVCRRRFLLRYVKQLDWPAPVTAQSEAWEAAMERGKQFHQLVYQDALDVDVSDLVADSDDDVLKRCWRNYRLHPPDLPDGRTFDEIELSVPLAGYRLTAKLDRVVVAEDGRVVIADWKTSARVPDLEALRADWQTIVYRYVVVEGGGILTNGEAIDPADVSLLYWYALHPDALPAIDYTTADHARAREQLTAIVAEIAGLASEGDFAKTDDWSACERCRYRSYCDRGRVPADDWAIREDELELNVLFEIEA